VCARDRNREKERVCKRRKQRESDRVRKRNRERETSGTGFAARSTVGLRLVEMESMALMLFILNVSQAVELTPKSFGLCTGVSTPGRLKVTVHRSFCSKIHSSSVFSKIAVPAFVWHAFTRNLSFNGCSSGGSSFRGWRKRGWGREEVDSVGRVKRDFFCIMSVEV